MDVTCREFRIQDLVWQEEQGTDITVSSSSAYGPSGLKFVQQQHSSSSADVERCTYRTGRRTCIWLARVAQVA